MIACPVKASANGRYLIDAGGAPFLLVGDAPQSLLARLDPADSMTYFIDRSANGFNSLWVELLVYPNSGGRSDGSLLDGTKPFTATIAGGYYDLTKPNPAYFDYVENRLRDAGSNGLQIFLNPANTPANGWLDTLNANGSNSCYAYGQYLGNRFKNITNLVWFCGNDYDQSIWSQGTNDVVVRAMALGIANADPNHMLTVLFGAPSDSLSNSNWWPMLDLNCVYEWSPTYSAVLSAYQHTNHLPVFLGEGHYEDEAVGWPPEAGNVDMGTPLVLREQSYWTMLSGGCGQLYGNHYIWGFQSDWKSHLNTAGVRQLSFWKQFFEARRWWELVPDTNHVVLTAGYGTYAAAGRPSTNDYATCAWTPDRTLAVIYTPVSHKLVVDMSRMGGPTTARWYDPTTADTFSTVGGSPFLNSGTRAFSTPGNNTDGDPDWVLLLETHPKPSPPSGLRVIE